MRRLLSLIGLLVFLGVFAAAGAAVWAYAQYQAAGPLGDSTLFVVEKGQGVSAVAAGLSQKQIIASPLLFRIAARIIGADTQIKAGEYQIAAAASTQQILQQMARGDVYQRQFTIPEGLTSWQIVRRLNAVDGLDGEIIDIPKEGTLLPETYSFHLGEDRQEKLAQMRTAMQNTLDDLWIEKPRDTPLISKAEGLILASIIEKETSVASERRRISGVFHNRLKKGMKLQTDPTVIYALTGGKIQDEGKGPLGRRLLSKDLQFDSAYNTYKYAGLPPGPIANPGRAAIEAAFNPEKHDYLYFVADGTGGHVFARTLEEHNSNVAKWRKIRKQGAN